MMSEALQITDRLSVSSQPSHKDITTRAIGTGVLIVFDGIRGAFENFRANRHSLPG
jgi:hypothetical protein